METPEEKGCNRIEDMTTLKKDFNNLLNDIYNYIFLAGKYQFTNPLRYRLNLLKEKYEKLNLNKDSEDAQKFESDFKLAYEQLQ